jgi:hypothetical protein
VTIGDIALNLFTGRLAIKSFRLADGEGPEPLVAIERADLRLGLLDLLRSHLRVRELTLIAPSLRVVRRGPAEFNFSDLLGGTKAPAPGPSLAPSRWTVTVERLAIVRGGARVDDRAVSPYVNLALRSRIRRAHTLAKAGLVESVWFTRGATRAPPRGGRSDPLAYYPAGTRTHTSRRRRSPSRSFSISRS